MNPADPQNFNLREIKIPSGRTYQFVDELPENYTDTTPTLLCLHGWPDLWYGWRYQIGPWVRKGARVIAPSMLGYGGTDKPANPEEYSTKRLCADLVALLDVLGIPKPVVIGHDWGSFTASRFALWHPDRLIALVLLSIPYTPPMSEHVSIHEIAKRLPNLRYQACFSDPDFTPRVEEILPSLLKMVFCSPSARPKPNISFIEVDKWDQIDQKALDRVPLLLNADEMAFYLKEFQKGMHGPLNFYRTGKFRYEEEKVGGLPSKMRADLPVLFIGGTRDPTVVRAVVAKAHKFIERLQDVTLEGKGHWIQIESKDEVTEQVLMWLNDLSILPQSEKAKM